MSKHRHSRCVLVFLMLLISGCGVKLVLTKQPESAQAAALPRSEAKRGPTSKERCERVKVLRGRAPHEWEIVAVIDLAAFSVRALPRNDEAFLELVRPAVCEAGGDAVIAGVNGDGRYVLGTVIAWTEPYASRANPDEDAKPEVEPQTTPAPAADPFARRTARPACAEGTRC